MNTLMQMENKIDEIHAEEYDEFNAIMLWLKLQENYMNEDNKIEFCFICHIEQAIQQVKDEIDRYLKETVDNDKEGCLFGKHSTDPPDKIVRKHIFFKYWKNVNKCEWMCLSPFPHGLQVAKSLNIGVFYWLLPKIYL